MLSPPRSRGAHTTVPYLTLNFVFFNPPCPHDEFEVIETKQNKEEVNYAPPRSAPTNPASCSAVATGYLRATIAVPTAPDAARKAVLTAAQRLRSAATGRKENTRSSRSGSSNTSSTTVIVCRCCCYLARELRLRQEQLGPCSRDPQCADLARP